MFICAIFKKKKKNWAIIVHHILKSPKSIIMWNLAHLYVLVINLVRANVFILRSNFFRIDRNHHRCLSMKDSTLEIIIRNTFCPTFTWLAYSNSCVIYMFIRFPKKFSSFWGLSTWYSNYYASDAVEKSSKFRYFSSASV